MSIRRLAIAALLFLISAAPARAQEFAYFGGLGPEYWGSLSPAWTACSTGTTQSPVDFGQVTRLSRRSRELPVRYEPSEGVLFFNGYTVEVETEGHNVLELDGVEYELVQFHFHTPSEHTFEGRGTDMELHLVHRSAQGGLAVVGILLVRGASSGALHEVLSELPGDVGEEIHLEEPFDPTAFLPRLRTNLRYAGSLTTPPCSEGVRWIVMDEPVSISDEDMARVSQLIRFNARPVQRSFR